MSVAASGSEQAALLTLKQELRAADIVCMGGPLRSTPRYEVPARVSNCPSRTPLGLRASCLGFSGELPSEVVRTTNSGFAVRFTELEPEALGALRRLLSLAELRVGSSPQAS